MKTIDALKALGINPVDAKLLGRRIFDVNRMTFLDTDEVDAILEKANTLLGGHGVESIRQAEQVDRYYYDIGLLYVNLGDTYKTTLLFDTERERFYITSWGSVVECDEERFSV